ncbi:hypothetical protein LY78DRAFT_726662 [Colletotrichum sublineola]|nr:hypothetical protein LY78DRAFT_726662 [Colletotrichum sublineola]
MSTPLDYSVDPSTNPATWPGPDQVPNDTNISKVNVIFINIDAASDFQMLHTGTNKHHHVLIQVAQHVARGLYRIVSLNITEYSCVVAMLTEKPRNELMKNGFPWDDEKNTQPKALPLASTIALPKMPNPIIYSIDLSSERDALPPHLRFVSRI